MGQPHRWGMAKVQDQYIWTTCNAQEQKPTFKTVNSMDGKSITAVIQKTLELFVIHRVHHAGQVLEYKDKMVFFNSYNTMRADCDVGLLYNLTDHFPIRLTGGSAPNRGILEIYVNGQWGTVCDDSFGEQETYVACKQLGYYGHGVHYTNRQSGTSSAPIWMDDVYCPMSNKWRTISRLADCQTTSSALSFKTGYHWGKHNCGHGEDVEIVCQSSGMFTQNVLKYLY